jgi:hypothetical protein
MIENPRQAVADALASPDPARIASQLDRLGRLELARFLADIAVIATEDGLSDAQRGRALRRQFDPEPTVSDEELQRAADGSIVRHGVSGWNR